MVTEGKKFTDTEAPPKGGVAKALAAEDSEDLSGDEASKKNLKKTMLRS